MFYHHTNTIMSILPGSPADALGIIKGSKVLSINNYPITDALDLQFQVVSNNSEIIVESPDRAIVRYKVELNDDEDLGIQLEPIQIARCTNRCVFCFVDQMPKNLRRRVYFKDEDYRLSFLEGNYVTLTNVTDHDINRIVTQGLSPLYVSVHATDPVIRNRLLGRKRTPDIMSIMSRLAEHGIELHAQIVLVPGVNDGAILEQSIRDLVTLRPSMTSIAVIPVGLTKHRAALYPITPPTPAWAIEILDLVNLSQRKNQERYGEPVVYAADELYLQAGQEIPPAEHYGDFPQWANGVGMIAKFIAEFRRELTYWRRRARWLQSVTVITGAAAAPTLDRVAADLRQATPCKPTVLPVDNKFFGSSVTVVGLLTGRDILDVLLRHHTKGRVIIPDNTLNFNGSLMLDDLSPDDLVRDSGCEIVFCANAAKGLLRGCRA